MIDCCEVLIGWGCALSKVVNLEAVFQTGSDQLDLEKDLAWCKTRMLLVRYSARPGKGNEGEANGELK